MAHSHCDSCIFVSCKQRGDTACAIEQCLNGCGASLHRCKVAEHVHHTCPETLVSCINAQYGCGVMLRRKRISCHLEHCPASTVMCKFSHDRMTTYTSRTTDDVGLSCGVSGQTDASEFLLDRRFLKGELEVAQSEAAVYCSGEFCYGDLDYGVSNVQKFRDRVPSDPNRPLSDLDVSVHCTLGVLTNTTFAMASECNAICRKPREKLCLKMPVQFRHHATKKCSGTKPRSRICYAFPCNELVRRDEFHTHWKCFHLDVVMDMSRIVERCPMHSYGCMFGETRLVPNPRGSVLQYHLTHKQFYLTYPTPITQRVCQRDDDTCRQCAEDLDPLNEQDVGTSCSEVERNGMEYGSGELSLLPAEVLMIICSFLDSMSLWNLSQTSRYVREVCLNVVRVKGIVYHKWLRDTTTGGWRLGPKTWSFSRVFHEIPSWSYLNTPAIGNHMISCDLLKADAVSYDDQTPWKLLDPSGPKVKTNKNLPLYIPTSNWYWPWPEN